VIAPTDMTARRGETIRLTCRAEVVGDRVVPVIRWTRVEGALPVNAGQSAGVLTIPSASPSDSGIYICTVTTVSGYVQQSQARVTVLAYRGPPTVRIEPDRQTISQGTRLNFVVSLLATRHPPSAGLKSEKNSPATFW
jgi:hypothetical protein